MRMQTPVQAEGMLWDAIVMFKAIILCALYNLSNDQVAYKSAKAAR